MVTKEAHMTDRSYWITVIELDDVIPRRTKPMPNLYIKVSIIKPVEKFNALRQSKSKGWAAGHAVKLRVDLSEGPFPDQETAERRLQEIVKEQRRIGCVINGNTHPIWKVYVIELDPAATSQPGKGYVYIGETSKDPEKRFIEHKSGIRSSRIVRQHGIRVRKDLAPQEQYFDEESAKIAEIWWHKKMNDDGYNAKGGH